MVSGSRRIFPRWQGVAKPTQCEHQCLLSKAASLGLPASLRTGFEETPILSCGHCIPHTTITSWSFNHYNFSQVPKPVRKLVPSHMLFLLCRVPFLTPNHLFILLTPSLNIVFSLKSVLRHSPAPTSVPCLHHSTKLLLFFFFIDNSIMLQPH